MTGKSEDLIRMEMALAHQEQQIADLSEMTTAQWKEIDYLKRKIDALMSRIDVMESGAADDKTGELKSVSEMAAAEKPPHY